MFIFNIKPGLGIGGLLVAALFLSPDCLAADSSLGVNATVLSSPCVVGATANQNINLGSFYTNALSSPGSATDWANFTITLDSCPVTTTSVNMKLEGDAEPGTQYFKNVGGTSTGVAIEVTAQQAGAASIGPGDVVNAKVVAATHRADFPLRAHMISPKGGATSGSVSGSIELTFSYQ